MKKILFLTFIATSAAAQSPVSCVGSNWTANLWQMCVVDNSVPVTVNMCTTNPGCTQQTQFQCISCGNAGTNVTSVTGTANQILATPTTGNVIISAIDPFSVGGPSAVWFTGTGSLIGLNEGTCTGTIPSLTDWICDSSTGLELGVAGGAFNLALYNSGPLGTPSSGNASNLTNFPTLNQNTTGNATTATDLASYPTLCNGTTQFSKGLASGTNNCANIPAAPMYKAGATFSGGGTQSTQVYCCVTADTSGTIKGWNIVVDDGTGAGTCSSCTATIKFWKVASGTSTPTTSNNINTSGVSLSTGTNIYSTTVTDFTTTVITAGDIIAIDLSAVANAVVVTAKLFYQ